MDFVSMRSELEKYNIFCSKDISEEELKEKFYSLPITESQKERLAVFGIIYNEDWSWTRKIASKFLDDAYKYNELMRSLPISPCQKVILMEHGIYDFENMTSGEAASMICGLPADKNQIDYIRKFRLSLSENINYGSALVLIRNHKERILGLDWSQVLGPGR